MTEPKRNEGDSQPIKPQTAPLKPPTDDLLQLRLDRVEEYMRFRRWTDDVYAPFTLQTATTLGTASEAIRTLQSDVRDALEKANRAIALIDDIENRVSLNLARLNTVIEDLAKDVRLLATDRETVAEYIKRELAEDERRRALLQNSRRAAGYAFELIRALGYGGAGALLIKLVELAS